MKIFHLDISEYLTLDFLKRACLFSFTTVSAVIINFGVNIIGHECFGISVNILYPIGLFCVSMSTFLLCRYVVYPGAKQKNVAKQGGAFVLSVLVFRCTEWGCFSILHNIFDWHYILCMLILQGGGTVFKFFFYNFFIFGRKDNNLDLKI